MFEAEFMPGTYGRRADPTMSFDRFAPPAALPFALVARSAEFLGLLSDEDRPELASLGRRRRADRPEVLLARGDPADRVIVLEAGRVKISVPTAAGDAVMTFRGPGALLGEQALVDDLPRSANVIAVEPVELLVIAASAFRAYLNRRPGVALAMLAVLSTRLRDSDRRLAEFAAADTLGRVSARLVELCDTHGELDEGGAVRVTLPITQDELAGWTGASLESTAKALRALRSLGWITTRRRAIEVHDLAVLRHRAP
jgi:CRP-like cAMP-binding protein